MPISTRKIIVTVIVIMVCVVAIVFVCDAMRSSTNALYRNLRIPVRVYQGAHLAYKDDRGNWLCLKNGDIVDEMEKNTGSAFSSEYSPMVVSMVEGRGIFVGSGTGNAEQRINAMKLSKRMYEDGGRKFLMNSHGGVFDGAESVVFMRLWPEPH